MLIHVIEAKSNHVLRDIGTQRRHCIGMDVVSLAHQFILRKYREHLA